MRRARPVSSEGGGKFRSGICHHPYRCPKSCMARSRLSLGYVTIGAQGQLFADTHSWPALLWWCLPVALCGAWQGYCVIGLVLVTASMRSCGRWLARRVASAMLVAPLVRW